MGAGGPLPSALGRAEPSRAGMGWARHGTAWVGTGWARPGGWMDWTPTAGGPASFHAVPAAARSGLLMAPLPAPGGVSPSCPSRPISPPTRVSFPLGKAGSRCGDSGGAERSGVERRRREGGSPGSRGARQASAGKDKPFTVRARARGSGGPLGGRSLAGGGTRQPLAFPPTHPPSCLPRARRHLGFSMARPVVDSFHCQSQRVPPAGLGGGERTGRAPFGGALSFSGACEHTPSPTHQPLPGWASVQSRSLGPPC